MERNSRKEKIVKVFSTKMDKSLIAYEQRKVKHPLYGKGMTKTKKYVVHDQDNKCKGMEGATIKIMETRPMSKTKRWRIVEIIEPNDLKK